MAIRFFVEGRNRARGYGLCGMRNYLGLFNLGNPFKRGGECVRKFFVPGFLRRDPWIQQNRG
jgi:hypothetical protein